MRATQAVIRSFTTGTPTDAFVLKDAPDGDSRFSTPSDSQVIYYVRSVASPDTARIFIHARDRRGGEAGVLIRFLLMDTTTTVSVADPSTDGPSLTQTRRP